MMFIHKKLKKKKKIVKKFKEIANGQCKKRKLIGEKTKFFLIIIKKK